MFDYVDTVLASNIISINGRYPVASLIRNVSALVKWIEDSPAMKGRLTDKMSRDQEMIVSILLNSCGLVATNALQTHVKSFFGGTGSSFVTARFLLSHNRTFLPIFDDRYSSHVPEEGSEPRIVGANDAFSPLTGIADRTSAILFSGLFDTSGAVDASFQVYGVTFDERKRKFDVRLEFKSTPAHTRGSKKRAKSWISVGQQFETKNEAIKVQAIYMLEHLPELQAVQAWVRKRRNSPDGAERGLQLASSETPNVYNVAMCAIDEMEVLLFAAHSGSKIMVTNTWYHVFGYSLIVQRLRDIGYQGPIHVPVAFAPDFYSSDGSPSTTEVSSSTLQYAGYELTAESSRGVQLAFQVL